MSSAFNRSYCVVACGLKDNSGLLQHWFYFVMLAITAISNNNIILTEVIAEIWEHGDVAGSPTARNTSSQMIIQVVNKHEKL